MADASGETARADNPKATVCQRLYEAILSGELAPGQRLTEADLAERFGVSRTPVREALSLLESDGLLEQSGRRGLCIRQLDHRAETELYLYRETLEGMAAALCARHISGSETEALRELLERERDSLDDSAEIVRINRLFHQQISRGSQNRYLADALKRTAIQTTLLGASTLNVTDRRATAYAEHMALFAAIEARDETTARRLGEEHVRSAHRERLRMTLTEV
ncbi:MAG: GntR family transcriptional regulator [Rhodospirillales bacterium]